MGVSFTKEQQLAIDTHGCNILVSAAAGSGKTAVLVERIIKMITNKDNPIDIDTLLVVTFTKAAASEMRERISSKINSLLLQDPEDENLVRQSALLNKASITTIDAFCGSVVRQNSHLIDIDPNYRIASQDELTLIQTEILDELLEDYYASGDKDFTALVETYASTLKDDAISDLILQIYKFSTSMPYPEKWISESIENVKELSKGQIYESKYGKVILDMIKSSFLECEGLINYTISQFDKFEPDCDVYLNLLYDDKNIVSDLLNLSERGLSALSKNFDSVVSFGRLSSKRPKTDIQTFNKELTRNCHATVKKTIESSLNKYLSHSEEYETELAKKLYPVIKMLGKIVIDFSNKYNAKKRDLLIADFNDILHFALNILIDEDGNPSQASQQLKDMYTEVITDEYQDSNYLQELILTSISREDRGTPNFFMVGDIKQSIYRFRLANPDIFAKKQNDYPTSLGGKNLLISLSKNFRSRECVIDAINFLFYQLMTYSLGEEEYNERSALYYGANFPEPEDDISISKDAEFYLIDTGKTDFTSDDEDEINDLKSAELEATVIANRIEEMLKTDGLSVFDKKTNIYRPLELKDIVILLRAPKNKAQLFINTLNERGIPATFNSSGAFFDCIEVQTMLNLLRIIDNPNQDIPIISILHSPIFNLTFDDIAEIRVSNSDSPIFYNAVLDYTQNHENDLTIKLNDFITRLNAWRELAVYKPISSLIYLLYTETNYYNYIGILPCGLQRQGNLKVLLEQANSFEDMGESTLFQFINYISKLEKNGSLSSANLSVIENCVQIVSIHHSKGLEFPVVFVAQLGSKFNFLDLRRNVLQHPNYGIGSTYVDYKLRTKTETMQKTAIKTIMQNEILSDELRVLYVAFTRAKEKLILIGSAPKTEDKIANLSSFYRDSSQQLPLYYRLKATSPIDWILAALSRHKLSTNLHTDIIEPVTYCDKIYNSPSKWKIEIISREDLVITQNFKNEVRLDLFSELKNIDNTRDHSGKKQEIETLLNWQYRDSDSQPLPSSISISEIKRLHQAQLIEEEIVNTQDTEIEFEIPQFMQDNTGVTTSGAFRGTAYHTLLEHIDFKADNDDSSIDKLINSLVARGVLTKEESVVIKVSKILTFLNSSIGKRLKNATSIYKETPFVMGVSPYDIYQDECYRDNNEVILVHGIIDLYFKENDKYVLLDYKTDYVPNNNSDIIVQRYKTQLALYKKALSKNLGQDVDEVYIYLFGIDTEVKL